MAPPAPEASHPTHWSTTGEVTVFDGSARGQLACSCSKPLP